LKEIKRDSKNINILNVHSVAGQAELIKMSIENRIIIMQVIIIFLAPVVIMMQMK
jgi:hypothetical protein